jgi:signal transduction histidine kinase
MPATKPLLAGIGSALFVLTLLGVLIVQQARRDARAAMVEQLDAARVRLEGALYERLNMVRGLAAFVRTHETFSDEQFQRFALALEGDRKGILSLQLAPDAVVTYLTHEDRNQKARGHDLLADPTRRALVERAIDNREYFLAGPLQLVQGGIALISRLPIFLPDASAATGDRFWGFSTILLEVGPLLAEAGIDEQHASLEFAVRGTDGRGLDGDVFFGDEQLFVAPQAAVDVAIPNGRWVLTARRRDSAFAASFGSPLLWLGAVAMALLLGGLVLVQLQRPLQLQAAADRAVKALEESQEQLRQAQKMESIGHLTGGVAHDFNNLLAIIGGGIELALMDATDDEQRDALTQAMSATKRGARLTQSLMAFARKQRLAPVETDLNDLIRNNRSMLTASIGEAIELRLQLTAPLHHALVDPNQLHTALLNLAINARDAMPDGGVLTIATRELPEEDRVEVSVTDTGEGMSDDVRERVFEPFFTTKPVGKGSGLGLSMVYGLMQQSGGDIVVDSEPGVGTVVRMRLPKARSSTPKEQTPYPETYADLPQARGETVLLTEDDAGVRRIMVRQLQRLGYRVLEAEDAASARERLDDGPVDVLLTDVVLGNGPDGYALGAEVRRVHPSMAVLYASGNHRSTGKPSHDDAVLLRKPVATPELARALRAAIDQRG